MEVQDKERVVSKRAQNPKNPFPKFKNTIRLSTYFVLPLTSLDISVLPIRLTRSGRNKGRNATLKRRRQQAIGPPYAQTRRGERLHWQIDAWKQAANGLHEERVG